MNDELTQHMPAVYRFSLRLARGDQHLAEELLQETMLRAVRKRNQVLAPEKLQAWLFAIAANVAKDLASRAATKRETSDEEALRVSPASAPKIGEACEAEELWAKTLELLDALPDRQRSVLYLSACEQMTLDQISQTLSISKSAAKASLSLARARIAQQLEVREASH